MKLPSKPADPSPFTLICPADHATPVLGRLDKGVAKPRRFAAEATAQAKALRLGERWGAWAPTGSSRWYVRRETSGAYDPATASATYTVTGESDEVLARFVTADMVATVIARAGGDASVFDDRDGCIAIGGVSGGDFGALGTIEDALSTYEDNHRVQGHKLVAYFTDSNFPDVVLTLEGLDYDNAANPLGVADERAIEGLAPGESHQPLQTSEDGPHWGRVTRLSAATQPMALVRGGVVLGIGLDEARARADAVERSPSDAEAADVEVYKATLAALSGWQDELLRQEVLAQHPLYVEGGVVRRTDVYDIGPDEEGTPNDPRWARDDWFVEEPQPPVPAPGGPSDRT
jgi:hypothetical protein